MRERTLRNALIAALTVLGLGASPPVRAADEIRYLAWDPGLGKGAVETAAGTQWVVLGDSVPGFGSVVELDAEVVVLRRVLSDAEREALARQGFVAPWAEEVEVLRWDLRFHGIPVATGSNP